MALAIPQVKIARSTVQRILVNNDKGQPPAIRSTSRTATRFLNEVRKRIAFRIFDLGGDGWNGLNGSFAASHFVRLSTGFAGLGSDHSGPHPCGAPAASKTLARFVNHLRWSSFAYPQGNKKGPLLGPISCCLVVMGTIGQALYLFDS